VALYDLVQLKQSLTGAVNADSAVHQLVVLRDRLANIKMEVPYIAPDHAEYINGLVDHYTQLIEQAQKPVDDFSQQLDLINQQINEVTHKLFANNYELEERYGSVEQVRSNRRIYIHEELADIIKQKIALYSSWKYPALEIGCRDGEWTQFLVAADPLYIMDRHTEFLHSANDRFPQAYQNRLRKYHLVDHNLSMLPQNQLGFVFSWGYFNYVSVDTMHQVLKQLKTLLRPGGVFMFSYNDGDTPAGAGMAENFAQSYMPKSVIVPLCLSLGFEVVADCSFSTNISWLEIKRPGQLTTVKAHQVLGEIKHWNALG
jgi:SAM-dependent methyltransferase